MEGECQLTGINEDTDLRVRFASGAVLSGPAHVADDGSVYVRLGAPPSCMALMVRRFDGRYPNYVKEVSCSTVM